MPRRQDNTSRTHIIILFTIHSTDSTIRWAIFLTLVHVWGQKAPRQKKTTIKNKVVKTKQTNNVKRNGRSHWNACLIMLCFWSNFVYSVTSLQFDGSLCVIPDVSVCVSSAMRYHRAIQSTNTRAAANSNIVVCALRFVHNFRA